MEEAANTDSRTGLREASQAVAQPIADLLKVRLDLGRSSPDLARYIEKNVRLLFRHLEVFAPRHMSEAAYRRALQLSLPDPDLRNFGWEKKDKVKGPADSKVFHLDHVMTVGDAARLLESLKDPTSEAVANVLKTAEIAWILVDEDNRLTQCKYRSYRNAAPRKCYEEVGIKLIEAGEPLPNLS